jgi:serine/threonine protein kinase
MTDTSYTLQPGDCINGYEIKDVLGTGGFGVTYRATDLNLSQEVAVKEYFPTIAMRQSGSYQVKANSHVTQPEYDIGLKRFHEEGPIMAKFSHVNIVRVLNVFEGNGTAYMVMEYEHGQDLDHYVKNNARPLGYGEIIGFFMPILDGLRAVHKQNVLHLDIKPDNIFIRTNSTPCLIDFGGARHYAAEDAKKSRLVNKVSFMVAADGYSPPEQYSEQRENKGPWSDIYALGATIYVCMSAGQPLIRSTERLDQIINGFPDPLIPATRRFQGKYPQELLELVDRCLAPQRDRRPQNAEDMQDVLIKIVNDEENKQKKPAPKASKPPQQQGINSSKSAPITPPPAQHFYSGSTSTPKSDRGTVVNLGATVYAGFWLRILAGIIDVILINVAGFIFGLVLGTLILAADGNIEDSSTELVINIIGFIFGLLYFSLMESSSMGATLGKRAVGIKVIDLQGNSISLGKAMGRHLGRILSMLLVMIGFLMVGFTRHKQGLHDMMAGTLVIKKA